MHIAMGSALCSIARVCATVGVAVLLTLGMWLFTSYDAQLHALSKHGAGLQTD